MCEEVAYPLASVNARIGRHIVSLATLMNLGSAFSNDDDLQEHHKPPTHIQSHPD
jgi:hypothetical protein